VAGALLVRLRVGVIAGEYGKKKGRFSALFYGLLRSALTMGWDYFGGSIPEKYPTITITMISIESPMRIVSAFTTRLDLPLSLYIKYSPLNKLISTMHSNTTSRIFI
jgi:hypothetical protein